MITVTAAEWPALGLSTVGQEWGWGLWDPPLPGELLATDGCWVWVWGADVLSYVATSKPTRLQWMVLQFWTHRRLWLDSVGRTTIHKDMNCVSRKGICRERGCSWGQGADKRGYVYETDKGQI